ncbi:pitrilysin family protein [Leuconostocaceae bacterium ESL0723]|nr:pitrilysin family protein [Leuconostocaceae bacterium ESL0723]
MIEKNYPEIGERLIEQVMPNGLSVTLIPKPSYHGTVGVVTAKIGALNTSLVDAKNGLTKIPAGTAHFLEHKLFDQGDEDAMVKFGQLGADANAFTNAYQTSYYFTTTQAVTENVVHLLDFVQRPVFTEENVARERGIIGQEIQMYADDSDWHLYMGLMGLLYPNSPLAEDIAGDLNSLQDITPDLLYQVYAAFYQPRNLQLTVVGNFDADELVPAIEASQAKIAPGTVTAQPAWQSDLPPVGQTKQVGHYPVSRPKLALGVRLPSLNLTGPVASQRVLAANLLLDLLFGEQTDWYQDLYQRGLVDNGLDSEYTLMGPYQYLSFYGESVDVNQLAQAIRERLADYQTVLPTLAAGFSRLKTASLGETVQRLNSLEQIALRGDQSLFGVGLFDKINLLKEINFTDLEGLADEILSQPVVVQYIIKS